MNDKEPSVGDTEELLNDIAARIRNSPVPKYPAPPTVDVVASDGPQFPRVAVFAVGCCLVVLCIVAITAIDGDRPNENLHPESQVAESALGDLIEGPIRITSFDPTPEFTRMSDGLDKLRSRLDRLETEVAVLEVQSDLASLLVEYTPNENTTR